PDRRPGIGGGVCGDLRRWAPGRGPGTTGQKDQPGVGHFLGALVGTGRAVRLTEKGTHAPLGGGFWPISSVVDGCRAEPKLLSTTSMVPFPCLGEDVGRVFLSPRTESHEPRTRHR